MKTDLPLEPPAANWLRARLGENTHCEALAGDAGHRRYFRVRAAAGVFVLMLDDSGVGEFMTVRKTLSPALTVPAVVAADAKLGLCLLEDFGDESYYAARDSERAGELHSAARRALIRLQTTQCKLPEYGEDLLRAEMNLFAEWYCGRYLNEQLPSAAQSVLARAQDFLAAEILRLGKTPVHRDYHSRNLMSLADFARNPGVLDFQDAVLGAPLYDAVSLLRDAYVFRPLELQRSLLREYWSEARAAGVPLPGDFEECWRGFNIVGAQRGLKVLGIFARLALRDGKRGFLLSIPLAYRYLQSACRAVSELRPLWGLLLLRPPKKE